MTLRDGPVGVVCSIPYVWDHGTCRCNSLHVNLALELDVQFCKRGARADVCNPILMHIVPAIQRFKVEYRARVCYSNVDDKYYKTARVLHTSAFISDVNFFLESRTNLMAVILVVGSLILLKGVTAKRIYKNWPLDVMETAIYFNLVAFSALTWYNLDSGENQVAIAYMSVMIILILSLGIIAFHILRYTRLYKCSFVEKAFK